jgi:hypothetical protein
MYLFILPALAQEPPQDAPPPEDSPAEAAPVPDTTPADPDLDLDIDAFLGDTALPPPVAATTTTAPLNIFNPRLTAFGDVFYSLGLDEGAVLPASGFWLKGLELDIRADVDPFAKAVAVIAMEQDGPELAHDHGHEEGEEEEEEHGHAPALLAHPEEVYVDLVAIPAGFSARVGLSRQPFGITNRMHPHDWPWSRAPLPLAETLGEEGLSDVGVSLDWRTALPAGMALSLQGGLLSGTLFDPDATNAIPAWIGRVELFEEAGRVDIGLGASALGQGLDEGVDGADLLLRWRASSWRSLVLIAEGFRGRSAAGSTTPGFTTTLQVQPTRPLYLGVRLDRGQEDWQYGGTLAFYTSEFLRLRGSVLTDGDLLIADAQLTFVWGSHPVEPYWVNR